MQNRKKQIEKINKKIMKLELKRQKIIDDLKKQQMEIETIIFNY